MCVCVWFCLVGDIIRVGDGCELWCVCALVFMLFGCVCVVCFVYFPVHVFASRIVCDDLVFMLVVE